MTTAATGAIANSSYDPQDTLMCATPNSIVAAVYYDVDPEDLVLEKSYKRSFQNQNFDQSDVIENSTSVAKT